MPQTILALLAMTMASTLSLQWQAERVHVQDFAVDMEYRRQALGVADEILTRVGQLAFDENGAPLTPEDCTPSDHFGSGRALGDLGVDDLDDLHLMRPMEIQRRVTNPETGIEAVAEFIVGAEVAYVDDAEDQELKTIYEASGLQRRTFYKRFTVVIDSEHLLYPIRIARVFSYQP